MMNVILFLPAAIDITLSAITITLSTTANAKDIIKAFGIPTDTHTLSLYDGIAVIFMIDESTKTRGIASFSIDSFILNPDTTSLKYKLRTSVARFFMIYISS